MNFFSRTLFLLVIGAGCEGALAQVAIEPIAVESVTAVNVSCSTSEPLPRTTEVDFIPVEFQIDFNFGANNDIGKITVSSQEPDNFTRVDFLNGETVQTCERTQEMTECTKFHNPTFVTPEAAHSFEQVEADPEVAKTVLACLGDLAIDRRPDNEREGISVAHVRVDCAARATFVLTGCRALSLTPAGAFILVVDSLLGIDTKRRYG
jgi:hypothetical protein